MFVFALKWLGALLRRVEVMLGWPVPHLFLVLVWNMWPLRTLWFYISACLQQRTQRKGHFLEPRRLSGAQTALRNIPWVRDGPVWRPAFHPYASAETEHFCRSCRCGSRASSATTMCPHPSFDHECNAHFVKNWRPRDENCEWLVLMFHSQIALGFPLPCDRLELSVKGLLGELNQKVHARSDRSDCHTSPFLTL